MSTIVALDTEFSGPVEGSSLYTTTVELSQVILPAKSKSKILRSNENLEVRPSCTQKPQTSICFFSSDISNSKKSSASFSAVSAIASVKSTSYANVRLVDTRNYRQGVVIVFLGMVSHVQIVFNTILRQLRFAKQK